MSEEFPLWRYLVMIKKPWKLILSTIFWVGLICLYALVAKPWMLDTFSESQLEYVRIRWFTQYLTIVQFDILIYGLLTFKLIDGIIEGVLNTILNLGLLGLFFIMFQNPNYVGSQYGVLTFMIDIPEVGVNILLYLQISQILWMTILAYLVLFLFDLRAVQLGREAGPCFYNPTAHWRNVSDHDLEQRNCIIPSLDEPEQPKKPIETKLSTEIDLDFF